MGVILWSVVIVDGNTEIELTYLSFLLQIFEPDLEGGGATLICSHWFLSWETVDCTSISVWLTTWGSRIGMIWRYLVFLPKVLSIKPRRSSVSCQARRSKPLAEVPECARETEKLVSLAEVVDPSCKSFLLRLLLVWDEKMVVRPSESPTRQERSWTYPLCDRTDRIGRRLPEKALIVVYSELPITKLAVTILD